MNYTIHYSRQAQKDARKLAQSNLKKQARELIDTLKEDPFQSQPRYETLSGTLKGCFSRRINIQHRLVYEVFNEKKQVLILRMWTQYGE